MSQKTELFKAVFLILKKQDALVFATLTSSGWGVVVDSCKHGDKFLGYIRGGGDLSSR
jgi:hypothetical protein